MVLPVVVDERHPVLRRVHARVVGVRQDESPGYRLGGPGCRCLGGYITYAHREAQFQGVGVPDPLADVPVVHPVVVAPCRGVKTRVVAERLYRRVKFREHLHVDFLLGVVSHCDALVGQGVAVRHRPVGVRHAVQHGHPEEAGEGVSHLVVSAVDYPPVRRVELRDDIRERPRSPVSRRVEGLEPGQPGVHRRADVAGERPACQALVELVHVLLHRDHKALHRDYLRPDPVVVGLHLLRRDLVRVGVQHLETGGAGWQEDCQRSECVERDSGKFSPR